MAVDHDATSDWITVGGNMGHFGENGGADDDDFDDADANSPDMDHRDRNWNREDELDDEESMGMGMGMGVGADTYRNRTRIPAKKRPTLIPKVKPEVKKANALHRMRARGSVRRREGGADAAPTQRRIMQVGAAAPAAFPARPVPGQSRADPGQSRPDPKPIPPEGGTGGGLQYNARVLNIQLGGISCALNAGETIPFFETELDTYLLRHLRETFQVVTRIDGGVYAVIDPHLDASASKRSDALMIVVPPTFVATSDMFPPPPSADYIDMIDADMYKFVTLVAGASTDSLNRLFITSKNRDAQRPSRGFASGMAAASNGRMLGGDVDEDEDYDDDDGEDEGRAGGGGRMNVDNGDGFFRDDLLDDSDGPGQPPRPAAAGAARGGAASATAAAGMRRGRGMQQSAAQAAAGYMRFERQAHNQGARAFSAVEAVGPVPLQSKKRSWNDASMKNISSMRMNGCRSSMRSPTWMYDQARAD